MRDDPPAEAPAGHRLLLGATMTPAELVGARIRQARTDLGLTQEQLGAKLKRYLGRPWPKQTVYMAERGRRQFDAAELLALAAVLGQPLVWFFDPGTPDQRLKFPGDLQVAPEGLLRLVLGDVPPTSPLITRLSREMRRWIASAEANLQEATRRLEILEGGPPSRRRRGQGGRS